MDSEERDKVLFTVSPEVIHGVAADIEEWRTAPSAEPEDWVFPSETLKTPLTRDNVWRRSILPKLQEAGLGWVNFQVMRRTHSTLMKQGVFERYVQPVRFLKMLS